MVERLIPPENLRETPSLHIGRYILGGVAACLLLAVAAAVAFLLIQEERKYDAVYKRLNMERLPKAIENMPYVQLELAKLRANPCNRQNVEDLVSSLDNLGQNGWAKLVRNGYFHGCLQDGGAASVAQNTLDGLAAGAKDAEVRRLALQVQSNTCDLAAARGLISRLQRDLKNEPVTNIGEAYMANCAADATVAYWTMQSFFYLGKFTRALELADANLKVQPNDPQWIYWRGRNLEKLGRTSEAANVQLYYLNMRVRPEKLALDDFWRAASLLRVAERYCEAVKVLEQYVSYDPDTRRIPQIRTAIGENRSLGGCP